MGSEQQQLDREFVTRFWFEDINWMGSEQQQLDREFVRRFWFEDINWNGQRAAATGQGICDEILKEKMSLCCQTSTALFLQDISRCSWIATCTVGHWR